MSEFLSALAGALVGFAGSYFIYWFDRRRRIKSLRWALGAEITTLMGMINAMGIPAKLRKVADEWEGSPATEPPGFPVLIADESYVSVFDGNVDSVGSLPRELAIHVVLFYQAVKSSLDILKPSGLPDARFLSKSELIKLLRERAGVLDNLSVMSESLAAELGGRALALAVAEVAKKQLARQEMRSQI